MEWLQGQPHILIIFQIILDLGLVSLLVIIMLRRKSEPMRGAEDLALSLEKVIEETRRLGEEFAANLLERQALIQDLLSTLDERFQRAQKVCEQLEESRQHPPESSSAPRQSPRQSDYRAVVRLAEKGLDAKAIAERLQKPIGEIELILNLQRLSADS